MSIQLHGIQKHFGTFVALDDVSLDVPRGSLMALLGPSGSGKSTLLRVIGGLESPDSGSVVLNGTDMTQSTPQSRGVGFVPQHYAVFPYMTVWQNVAFGLQVRKLSEATIRQRVDEQLKLVELDGLGSRYPSQLSGGQQQRVALARALAVQPTVLLLDEPFAALDARVRHDLREWLRHLQEKLHVTTVLVTHDQEEAMEVADRVAVIDHGRVQQVGRPLELYERPANAFVMRFVGPVTSFDGGLVRPHNLKIRRVAWDDHARAGVVERLTVLGFEVRVELRLADGSRVWSQMARAELESLGLERGMHVHVVPVHATRFAEARG